MTFDILNQIAAKLGADVAKAMFGPLLTISADGAIPIDQDRVVVCDKAGAAAALTMAAPGAANVGRRIAFTTNSAFAHVVTWPAAIVNDGTTGANATFTAVAVAGCSFAVVAISATNWNVESFNLGVFAP